MTYLRVRNWEQYQHYKDRRPVWVKLYVSQLRDSELKRLPLSTRLLWDQLLLLAAEYENSIPNDSEEICAATRIPLEDVTNGIGLLLQGAWLKESRSKRRASRPLAESSGSDSPEQEQEVEQEQDKSIAGDQPVDNHEKEVELEKLVRALNGANGKTAAILRPLVYALPLSVVADVRSRAQGKGAGWAVNALKAIREETTLADLERVP